MENENDILKKAKKTLNEMSKENVVYEEIQTGPMEEPYLVEYQYDLKRFRDYIKRKKGHKT